MRWLTLLISYCAKERHPSSIAWALLPAFGIAVFPPTSLQWICAVAAVILLRINLFSLFFFTLVFWLATGLTDKIAHPVGETILLSQARPMWARFYHAPIFPYTLFNHTTVMGYLVIWLSLIPLCFLTTMLVRSHGNCVLRKLYATDLYQSFIASRLYRRFAQILRYENN